MNSIGASALLEARGNASVALDSVTLMAHGVLPSAVGLFFQGNQQQASGVGSAFGDGLLCVNNSVIRLGIRSASAGAVSFGYGVGIDPHLATVGQLPASGATRHYQLWYRDPVPFCTASTFNLSNGLTLVWTP